MPTTTTTAAAAAATTRLPRDPVAPPRLLRRRRRQDNGGGRASAIRRSVIVLLSLYIDIFILSLSRIACSHKFPLLVCSSSSVPSALVFCEILYFFLVGGRGPLPAFLSFGDGCTECRRDRPLTVISGASRSVTLSRDTDFSIELKNKRNFGGRKTFTGQTVIIVLQRRLMKAFAAIKFKKKGDEVL